jgi:hypothetical protein
MLGPEKGLFPNLPLAALFTSVDGAAFFVWRIQIRARSVYIVLNKPPLGTAQATAPAALN